MGLLEKVFPIFGLVHPHSEQKFNSHCNVCKAHHFPVQLQIFTEHLICVYFAQVTFWNSCIQCSGNLEYYFRQ